MQIRCKFGQLGPGKGQFNSPHGFCLGLEEEIIVADTNNHRIQVTFPACFAHDKDWIHLPMQLCVSGVREKRNFPLSVWYSWQGGRTALVPTQGKNDLVNFSELLIQCGSLRIFYLVPNHS